MSTRDSKRTRARTRGRLSCEEIVAAALAESAERGDVSMRALGKRLQVDPMAIYRYFRDKDALLDAMADEALADMHAPSSISGTALSRLRRMSIDFRVALRAHPGIAWRFSITRPTLGPHVLELMESTLGLLAELGLEPGDATRAYVVLIQFISGSVGAEERVRAAAMSEADWQERLQSAYKSISPKRYPHIARGSAEFGALGFDEQFEVGLNLLLGAISQRGR